ncbi:MAG TPA: protein kinase [Candidatus Wallbacteria bacterium]|nr:protein kinase [Candidatus Wallbacteria bacterium]
MSIFDKIKNYLKPSNDSVREGPAEASSAQACAEELKALSEKYIRAEEYEKAALVLKKLVDLERTGNHEHYCELLRAYYKSSLHEDAVEVFRMAIEFKSGLIEKVLPVVAEFFDESFGLGNKKMILLYGDCAVSAHVKRGDIKSAIAVIDKILSLYPKMTPLLKRKAFLMIENGDAGLTGILGELFQQCPDDSRIRYEYCRVLNNEGRCLQSLKLSLEALSKNENTEKFIEIFMSASQTLIKERNFSAVIDSAPQGYKLTGSFAFLKIMAETYLKSGDLDRANDIYMKVVQKDESDAESAMRQKYIQTLIGERDLAFIKNPSASLPEIFIDGIKVAVKNEIECDSATTVNAVDEAALHFREAEMHYARRDYKNAIINFQNAVKSRGAGKFIQDAYLRLVDCFLKENMTAAAEKTYRSVDFLKCGLQGPAALDFKYLVAAAFIENGCAAAAESILSEIAAADINYKDAALLLKKMKENKSCAENDKTVQAETVPAGDAADRTVIASAPSEEDFINSRYRIIKLIGKGGMGSVYKAFDTREKRYAAIKIPILAFKNDASFMKRFEREADISSGLKHPNILNVYEVVKGEMPYMVMELINGRSLREVLNEKKSLPHMETRHIALQCCDALEYTHGRQVVHRDIKPENIMLLEDGSLRIMDFGLSKALDDSAITKAGTILGTFAYISPEQCLGEAVDGRADIYSLGVVLYEMLTGEKPFACGDYVEQHLKARPVAPTKKKPSLPYPVEIIVLKCLEKKPRDRFSSAAELKEAWLKIVK